MIRLNPEQQFIVDRAVDWFYRSNDQIFQYDGPPGSGKSVVLNEIVHRIGLDPLLEVAAMSYIGAASLVMRTKGLFSAKTIHSWIYDIRSVPMRDKDGNIMMDTLLNKPIMYPKFVPVDSLDPNIQLIIVDEGYCCPMSLRPQIEKFGIKILVCGDQNQLPPVNDNPAFLVNGNIYHLTQCMRQADRRDIDMIAKRVGSGLPLLNGYYGNSLVIGKNELTDDMLMWADAVICSKNRTRDTINKRIRSILGHTSELPEFNEKVVCRKNNWLDGITMSDGYTVNLVNGLIGRVMNQPDISSFDGKLFTMYFSPDLAPQLRFNARCNYKYMIANYEERNVIKSNRYETGNMFEFAYAITTHISQGSQFHKVLYIEEPMHPAIQNRLNLVGASRADEALIYVKPF